MEVGFDQQIYRRQNLGGISRYFSDLERSLRAEGVTTHTGRRKNWIKTKIVHATFYSGAPYSLYDGQILVSSLFDMIPEKHPEYFPLSKLYSPHRNKKKWLKQSNLIISISDSSSDDLEFFYPKLNTNIRRIHLSTSIQTTVAVPVKCLNEIDYFLYVGKRAGYKNGTILFQALSLIKRGITNSKHIPFIVFAGGGEFSNKEKKMIEENNLTNHLMQINVDDHKLSWLYKNAKACLVPSIAEGFSLPLIESLVLNTPLAASDIEVHKEVSKGFSTLISSNNAKDWAEFLLNRNLQKPKKMLGSEYNSKCLYFSASRLAKEHIKAYIDCQY